MKCAEFPHGRKIASPCGLLPKNLLARSAALNLHAFVTIANATIKGRLPLTFDLEQFLPYRLYQATDGAGEAFLRDHLTRFGISRSDWRVLFNIGQYGPLSAIHIAQRANLEKTAISRSVQRLVLRGWVERAYPAADRRRQDLALTAEGIAVFAELRDMAAAFNAKLEALLDCGDVKILVAQLQAIEAGTRTS